MHYTEYDESGNATEQVIVGFDPEIYYDVDRARLELTTTWRASETGRKKHSNAHGPFLVFVAKITDETRRICPVIEVGRFWRRGRGLRLGQFVVGAWVPMPWLRPAPPTLHIPERVDLSPAELRGDIDTDLHRAWGPQK